MIVNYCYFNVVIVVAGGGVCVCVCALSLLLMVWNYFLGFLGCRYPFLGRSFSSNIFFKAVFVDRNCLNLDLS